MRLIDTEKIEIPTSMIYRISGCYMIRVEDVQRIISDQPVAFDKEKVKEELENYLFEKYCIEGDEKIDEIIEKGGIERRE